MHAIAPFARAAFAQGLAISGGPITERVKAGCLVAVELAVERADDPGVLEATLRLGALEGTWAVIYDRRAKLHDDNEQRIIAAWRALRLARLAPALVAAARRQAGLSEAATANEWLSTLIQQAIASNANVSDLNALMDSIGQAITTAQAEGVAAAQALRADPLGAVGFSFDIAFHDAYNALQRPGQLLTGATQTDAWLNRLLAGNADEVGAKLSTLTRAGAPYEEMASEVGAILDGAGSRSIQTAVDVLTSRALSQGSLDLYRADGLSYVDFLTAGGQRVCPVCSALEKRNPYRIEDAPMPSIHVYCRCVLAPANHPANNLLSPLAGPLSNLAALAGQAADTELLSLADRYAAGVTAERVLGGGMSAETSILDLADGSQAVRKVAKPYAERPPKESTDAEALAALFGRALGVPVPEVARIADNTVVMDYISGARTGAEAFNGADAKAYNELQALVNSTDGRKLGLFDLATANLDRNDGNWLLDAERQLWGIDHGMAYDSFSTVQETVAAVAWRNPFAGRLLEFDNNTMQVVGGTRNYSRADIDHMKAVLRTLEPEFRKLRRLTWYRQTLSRLSWLAKHAGTDETPFI